MMCVIAIFAFTNRLNWDSPYLIGMNHNSSNFLMVCLLCEHMFSYIVAFYRARDIERNGQIDINGVKRAPTELFIGNIQFFIACIIIGFTINFFLDNETKEIFNNEELALQHYWIIIDVAIIFLAQAYISTSLYMKVSGEVVKNLYSLYFLQKNILQQ